MAFPDAGGTFFGGCLMTHELILTSVAQGLDPKDHGFCPVAADSEISPRVIQYLTALSGYRHVAAELDQSSQWNPVAYSHFILPGELEHVLSRVAGTGVDYQGHPNTLAHHVVLERMECPAESPAWLLALPCFHLSTWNGSPVRFSQGRPIPTLTNPPSLTRRQQIARQFRWLDPQKIALTGLVDSEASAYLAACQNNDGQITLSTPPTTPCPAWKELTGDSGWGGVLAETVFTGQPVVLIYNPEQNILPLFVEALALLPEYSAWRTTFCTYFTGLPEETPCQWKGVIAGSEEVEPLIKDLNNLVIDLTVMLGEAPSGKYVDFARLGQEHMLPQDIEECAAVGIVANMDTKSYDIPEQKTKKTNKLETLLDPAPIKEPHLFPPKIQLPPKHGGLLESLLRSSRFQFYFLYSIMFALVLFLLVLAIDQAGDFGIVQSVRNWNQQTAFVPPDEWEPEPKPENIVEWEVQAETDLEQMEQEIFTELETSRKTFEEHRAEQREPLLLFLESFDVPEFLAINFPTVQNNHINIPEKKRFDELKPLHDFRAALELHFIPLFELPSIKIETSLIVESLPDWVWRTSAIDNETNLVTPMFHFQLMETGLEMEWQPEGLNNQHLYDTIFSSLGFLQLSVTDMPESAIEIPLFVPVETTPMKVSDLANLSEQDPPEHVIDLPFASELWQAIFATMNPPRTLRFEVRAEPEGDWIRIESPSESQFQAKVRTGQEAKKLTESGDIFENIVVMFAAEASLEKIVWKGDEYAERLRAEQGNIRSLKEELENKIGQLETRIFDGDQSVRQERDAFRIELRDCDLRLGSIESILEKLPAAYREISENESGHFHYSVFLGSESTKRPLLIFRTVP